MDFLWPGNPVCNVCHLLDECCAYSIRHLCSGRSAGNRRSAAAAWRLRMQMHTTYCMLSLLHVIVSVSADALPANFADGYASVVAAAGWLQRACSASCMSCLLRVFSLPTACNQHAYSIPTSCLKYAYLVFTFCLHMPTAVHTTYIASYITHATGAGKAVANQYKCKRTAINK